MFVGSIILYACNYKLYRMILITTSDNFFYNQSYNKIPRITRYDVSDANFKSGGCSLSRQFEFYDAKRDDRPYSPEAGQANFLPM